MKQACSTGGTGWPLFDFTAGKTKIQVPVKPVRPNRTLHPECLMLGSLLLLHLTNPEISVTVLIEEGGQGSDVAGPIAKDIEGIL